LLNTSVCSNEWPYTSLPTTNTNGLRVIKENRRKRKRIRKKKKTKKEKKAEWGMWVQEKWSGRGQ